MKPNIFLDSGAYSAFTKNAQIDIYKYIEFIKRHQQYIETYAVLDVIGNAEGTMRNMHIMESEGLKPIPVFHAGSDWKHLEYYANMYDYIGLGGVALIGKDEAKRTHWLDHCFSICCDNKGWPRCKVHGFAVTAIPLMWRYPWYSVDSTRWVKAARYGQVFTPVFKHGKPDYSNLYILDVSYRSPRMKEHSKSLHTMSDRERGVFLEYFKDKGIPLGKAEIRNVQRTHKLQPNETWIVKWQTVQVNIEPGIVNEYTYRDVANLIFFKDLQKRLPRWPWQWMRVFKKQPTLLDALNCV